MNDERFSKIRESTKHSNFRVIQAILAHPTGFQTPIEISFFTDTTLKETKEIISRLETRGIIEQIEEFYRLSDEGMKIVDHLGLLENRDMMQRSYDRLEKPSLVRDHYDRDRPQID